MHEGVRVPPVRVRCALAVLLAITAGAGSSLLGICGPFTDVAADAFCPFVLEIFYLGITTGTTATTYDPASPVSRLQMAAFLSRTVDSALLRGGRRAALGQYWNTQTASALGMTTVGDNPEGFAWDGKDLWVPLFGGNVVRVRASDGKVLENWTGGAFNVGVLAAIGRIFVTGQSSPGRLYRIDPSQSAGTVQTVASNLPNNPGQMTFDGARIWTANWSGSVSIITPGSIPWTVTTVTTGAFGNFGVAFDGANIWVSDHSPGNGIGFARKVNAAGATLLTVTVGQNPDYLLFDGSNIWVPNSFDAAVSVIRASNGALLATLTGNGMVDPSIAAFDGKRVLITSPNGQNLSLFKAADLTPIGFVPVPPGNPLAAGCDTVNFWVAMETGNTIARF
ncbi:MAG TPA: S-layer homology domain-containing protein [Thermoanaerobaculia bacterium]|nr:S-layer homology domain-containing protein [Thermoanaerobaculia bacterium]